MLNILAVAPQETCLVQKDGRVAVCRPAERRGERSCLTSGRLHETSGSCSWILPDTDIDSSCCKSQPNGLVRLDRRDICNGTTLRRGDHVVFFLFADQEHGLAAEGCCLKSRAVMRITESPLWLLDNEDSDEEEFFVPAKAKKAFEELEGGCSDASSSTACLSEAEEEPEEDEPCEEPCGEEDCFDEAVVPLPCGPSAEPCGEPCEEPCDDEVSCQACEASSDASSRAYALHCAGTCKPCTFFRWGACKQGDDCDNCHLPHGAKFGVNPMDFDVNADDSDDDF